MAIFNNDNKGMDYSKNLPANSNAAAKAKYSATSTRAKQ